MVPPPLLPQAKPFPSMLQVLVGLEEAQIQAWVLGGPSHLIKLAKCSGLLRLCWIASVNKNTISCWKHCFLFVFRLAPRT